MSIVPEPLRGDHDFIEDAAVAVFGIHGEGAGQQADAVAIVNGAAILIEAAAEGAETVAGFKRVDDVVVAPMAAARCADLFRRERDGRLGETQSEENGPGQ